MSREQQAQTRLAEMIFALHLQIITLQIDLEEARAEIERRDTGSKP